MLRVSVVVGGGVSTVAMRIEVSVVTKSAFRFSFSLIRPNYAIVKLDHFKITFTLYKMSARVWHHTVSIAMEGSRVDKVD